MAARLRQRVSPQIASLTLEALLRRGVLEPQARLTLFRELADYFKTQVAFPEEAVEQLADEHYVRNVAEILFRAEKPASYAEKSADHSHPDPPAIRRML